MQTFTTFVRRTPHELLRRYFDQAQATLPKGFAWTANPPALARHLSTICSEWDRPVRERVYRETERISRMADDAGQTALFGVVEDQRALERLGSGYARATSVFLENLEEFRRAERHRYSDDLRMGQLWTGFHGPSGMSVPRDGEPLQRFSEAVRALFDTANIHIDVYDRSRPEFDDDPSELVQVTIYREGRLDEEDCFIDGALTRVARRRVFEAAVIYNRDTGVTEVVGPEREQRLKLAELFHWHLLGSMFVAEQVTAPLYDLGRLRQRHLFPTEPADGIENVRLVTLRLEPLDTASHRITLDCARTSPGDIWTMAKERFGPCDPLQGGWRITQAKLAIRFMARPDGRGARTLPVTIVQPNSCDLKDRDRDQRLIGQKYLAIWGLVRAA